MSERWTDDEYGLVGAWRMWATQIAERLLHYAREHFDLLRPSGPIIEGFLHAYLCEEESELPSPEDLGRRPKEGVQRAPVFLVGRWIEPNETGYGNTTRRLILDGEAWTWDEQEACAHGIKLRWSCGGCEELLG